MMVPYSRFSLILWILCFGVLVCTIVYCDGQASPGLVYETDDAIIIEGVPTMRPILVPMSTTPPLVDEAFSLDELLDVVPETIEGPQRSDTRHRRSKDSSASQLGSKSKKKTSKNSIESATRVTETESVNSKLRRPSTDKKKRRGSRERKGHRRTSDEESRREEKSTVAGEEPGTEAVDNKDEIKGGTSVADMGERDLASHGDLSGASTLQPEEPPVLSIDSWRIQFPDETATIVMEHGNHYKGRISRKLMEGEGTFSWADGAQYSGAFVDGEMTGKGRLTWPDMSKYEGDLVKGWRYGRGLYVASYKKTAYVGDWVAGRKHGSGLILYDDQGSNMYDGEWDNDQRQGYGLRVYPSGARYLGDWKQGLRDGVGTMIFANGDVYSGNWEKGLMSGYGEYIWGAFLNNTLASFGDNVYSGWFEGGIRQGEATYELNGRQQIYGEWQSDNKEGRAKVICGDGSVYIGNPMFEDDRPATRKIETLPDKPTTMKRTSKVLSKANLISKPGKLPSRRISQRKSMSHLSKLPPPNPDLILHGYYLPVYAPFQRIDLRYHLVLLKTLKHPQEDSGCQTDDTTLVSSSSCDCELNSTSQGVLAVETKGKLKIKSLPNEQSTQAGDGLVKVRNVSSLEEEIPTLQKSNSKTLNARTTSNKLKVSKESQQSSPTTQQQQLRVSKESQQSSLTTQQQQLKVSKESQQSSPTTLRQLRVSKESQQSSPTTQQQLRVSKESQQSSPTTQQQLKVSKESHQSSPTTQQQQLKVSKESQQSSLTTSIDKNLKYSGSKLLKGKINRHKHSRGRSMTNIPWPVRRQVLYPGGQTEQASEEKWLRQTLTRHLPAIRQVYEEYARIGCCSEEAAFQPFLLRAMLWQFYRDCKITTRVSLIELDQMLADNPQAQVSAEHFPFERIQMWQFIYSLIDVAWTLYASKGLGSAGSRGVLGSAFDKLMYDDVFSRPPVPQGSVLFEQRDLLPLAAVYMLYQSLGEPLAARTLLQLTCCRKGTEPETPPPRAIGHYPDFVINGVNAFVLAEDLTFLPRPPPLASVEKPVFEVTTDTTLAVFRNVGVHRLTKVLVEVCPSIKADGVIVNMDYQMTFLEFYEVLIKCESRSYRCEQRRLAKLAALEKYRLELEAKRSEEDEKVVDIPIELPNKSGKTKQKKGSKLKV